MTSKSTNLSIPAVNRILTGRFEMNAGYHVRREKGTTDWLLICTTAGGGVFDGPRSGKSVGHPLVTGPGDLVLIRPGTPHDYGISPSADRWNLLWAHFHPRPDWHALLDWPAAFAEVPGLMRLSIDGHEERQVVEQALCKMNDHAVGSHRLSKSLAMNALEESLLWCARRILRNADHDPRIEQAEDFLCQHLSRNVSLRELADVVGLSVSRLGHVFKQQTGLTPQRYYETQRHERARQLLELTSLPVGAIAAEVGFDNPFYFTLRFKRYTGKSPKAYRRSVQE